MNRYDSRTTIFSPDGRLYQVEYAMTAIGHAGSCIGVLAPGEGVVLAAEKKVTSKLLEPGASREKMFEIDQHVACTVAGITSDANILVEDARLAAQRHKFSYQEPIPLEQLVESICDRKQAFTQYGGQRPFGVSFLFAGWDDHGFQLFKSDPSGNYGGWKAAAIGANNQAAASILKQEWKDSFKLDDAVQLAIKVLTKTMDNNSLDSEKIEFARIERDADTGRVRFYAYPKEELDELLKTVIEKQQKEEKEKAEALEREVAARQLAQRRA